MCKMETQKLQICPEKLHDSVIVESTREISEKKTCSARVLKSRNSLVIPKQFIEENGVLDGDYVLFAREHGRFCAKVYRKGERWLLVLD